MEEQYKTYNIVFFDGVCNLCNAAVDRIFRHNKKRDLYYASLQSDFAKRNLPEASLHQLDSIVFYSEGKLFYRSDAAIRIAKHLSGAYRLFAGSIIFPRFLRDAVYNFVARNRYKFFGKKSTCRIASADEKKYFIEN